MDVILEIDVEGAKQVKALFPETILIFIMAPSMEEIKRRIKKRNTENPEQIIKRFRKAYQEINEINKYNYVVVNDNVLDAVKKIEAILISEKCRVDRIEEISVENEEEIIHEFQKEIANFRYAILTSVEYLKNLLVAFLQKRVDEKLYNNDAYLNMVKECYEELTCTKG